MRRPNPCICQPAPCICQPADRDYFTVPDEQLKEIRADLTIVDGAIVHDSGAVT